jgi:hypothetical protein
MRHRDNSVITEFLPNHTLHDFICFGIDAGMLLVIAARGDVVYIGSQCETRGRIAVISNARMQGRKFQG